MSGKYNTGNAGKDGHMIYDDAAFNIFLVALLAVYWIPTALFRTILFIRKRIHVRTALEEAKESFCACSLCQNNPTTQYEKKKAASFGIADFIFLVVTIALAFTAVRVYRGALFAEPPFDPFAILQVDETATPKQLKRAFRRLSVLHHPDKNRDDPTAGERFIKITKAFAALTDEASKENFIKYGNPDGYMGTVLGLGLPEWVAESQNAVLMAYVAFILLIFPTVVGIWWRKRSLQLTSTILTATFRLYGETLSQTSRFRDLLAAFCGSLEFAGLHTSDNDETLATLGDALKRKGKTDLSKAKTFTEPTRAQLQNLLVLSAYLARMPIPENLQYILKETLLRSESLLTAMTDTVGAFPRPDCQAAWDRCRMHGHTTYISTCIRLMQCLVQGVEDKMSPLLQIPHFTDSEVKFCMSHRPSSIRSVYDFMKLEMAEQKILLRSFSDEQLLDAKAFCDRYPLASLDVSEANVEGERDGTVHAGDSVTVRVKLSIFRRSGSIFSPHTPNLPFRKEEVWWIWLADQRLMCPIEVRRLSSKMARGHDPDQRGSKNLKGGGCCGGVRENEDEEATVGERLAADPRVSIFDVRFNFIAPRSGTYNLEVKAFCDCYTGADKSKVIKMKVLKELETQSEGSLRYFDTDDESSSEEESEEESEEDEGDEDEDDTGTDGEYEYIEVTDESDGEEEDDFGVSEGPRGDPMGG